MLTKMIGIIWQCPDILNESNRTLVLKVLAPLDQYLFNFSLLFPLNIFLRMHIQMKHRVQIIKQQTIRFIKLFF